ncbi:hypothetical protein [Mesorhizobium sp.]|uniref:hypothetical protein n=1 Tax=Mesorhizobium sp. TaxID=1871066 RepID=UPI000FE52434|nr:hypothetical protein [Mesorhizobium sp.]RWK53152.1 MAG: hypothetical protein EOR48_22595 [Mesorhizobium sp.]TIP43533.1 MAG: hypothetical protein E5X62_18405 [Mesorhizobium sp.]
MRTQKGRPVGAADVREFASQVKLVAGMRNHLALAGKEKGRPDVRTADLIKQVKLVAGACNRLNLLFDAPRLQWANP